MQVVLAALCDAANIGEGDKLNILGTFHAIMSPAEPVTHLKMSVVLSFRPTNAETGRHYKMKAVAVNDKNEVVWDPGGALEFDINRRANSQATEIGADTGIINMVMNLVGVKFPTFGNYSIRVSLNGEPLCNLPIQVAALPKR